VPAPVLVFGRLQALHAPGFELVAGALHVGGDKDDIARETGLSKSAVQQALRSLRRRLVNSHREHQTDTPEHEVERRWVR